MDDIARQDSLSPPATVASPVEVAPLGRIPEFLVEELSSVFSRFLRAGHYILGPSVERFEKEFAGYLGAAHVVGCKSGTYALILALRAAEIGSGDEVITVGNTYYATAQAIRHVGARPVFADVDPEFGLLDPNDLDSVRTSNTKAVLAVHLYGLGCQLRPIRAYCARHGLELIEDCAHAFGTEVDGVKIGAESKFACFSLYPTKTLGAFGDAGMVATSDGRVAERLRDLRYYALDNSRRNFDPAAEHARLDALQAELLCATLRFADDWIAQRRAHERLYRLGLSDIPGLRVLPAQSNQLVAPYTLPIFSRRRNWLANALRERGVGVQIHYPTNLHELPQFGGPASRCLRNTERHNAEVLNLPVHPYLRPDEIKAVIETIRHLLARGGR
jgi:dTDP-4-amino-4,6-dideoxygalactose transaminase